MFRCLQGLLCRMTKVTNQHGVFGRPKSTCSHRALACIHEMRRLNMSLVCSSSASSSAPHAGHSQTSCWSHLLTNTCDLETEDSAFECHSLFTREHVHLHPVCALAKADLTQVSGTTQRMVANRSVSDIHLPKQHPLVWPDHTPNTSVRDRQLDFPNSLPMD